MCRDAVGPKFEGIGGGGQMGVRITKWPFVEDGEEWHPEDAAQPQLRIQHCLDWEEYTDFSASVNKWFWRPADCVGSVLWRYVHKS